MVNINFVIDLITLHKINPQIQLVKNNKKKRMMIHMTQNMMELIHTHKLSRQESKDASINVFKIGSA
jgi:hypothetical protein